jgi:hypothetical protein
MKCQTWTVKAYSLHHKESTHAGVFEIQEVQKEAEKWENASFDAQHDSPEEASALRQREGLLLQAKTLIEAAPDLAKALTALLRLTDAHLRENTLTQEECAVLHFARQTANKAKGFKTQKGNAQK